MPKTVHVHPSERIDKVDFQALSEAARDAAAFAAKKQIIDRRDRILDGFRVEILDQAQFPGRITIHNGMALDYDGATVTTEDQPTASRTVLLDGANTNFYVEIEFSEAESDVGARAFWDPTVDQGLDASGDELPDGQETSANVATRKTPDWRVVTPISTTGFTRDQPGTLNSVRIPLVKLRTNGSNEIDSVENTNLVTEKASTVVTKVISTTQVVLKHPQLFVAGQNINVIDPSGTQASSITSVDYNTGLAVIAAVTAPVAGAIIKVTTASAPDFVKSDEVGPYRRYEADLSHPDHVVTWQDRLFQGDEVNGRILSQGHADWSDRGDINLDALKDYVDFLAGQIQEMKWGSIDPHLDPAVSNDRIPPGISPSADYPATPRYFDRSTGIVTGRSITISVGDGATSRGDFTGNDQTALQVALNVLNSAGVSGTILLKRGTYTLTANVNWYNTEDVTLVGEDGAVIECNGGGLNIQAPNGKVKIKNVVIQDTGAAGVQTGLLVNTGTPPDWFEMENVRFEGCAFTVTGSMTQNSRIKNCVFHADNANMSATALIQTTASNSYLSGAWDGCTFHHESHAGAGTVGALIETFTPVGLFGTTVGLLKFTNCSFSTQNGPSSVSYGCNLGDGINSVVFDKCVFSTGVHSVHIEAKGGRGLTITDCVGLDATIALLQAQAMSRVKVDGYRIESYFILGGSYKSIRLENCSLVRISNCYLICDAGLFGWPLGAGIAVESRSGGTCTDILIENNTIYNTTAVGYGISFWIESAGGEIRDVTVRNNQIGLSLTGIGILDSSGGDFVGFVIDGNEINDGGIGASATNMAYGIYATGTADFRQFTVTNNQIRNANVASPLTNMGGIWFAGWLRDSTIANNSILEVGDSTTRPANAAGIYLGASELVTVANNSIRNVYASDFAAAIVMSDTAIPGPTCIQCAVEGNTAVWINANATSGSDQAFGVTAIEMWESTVSNNTLNSIGVGDGTAAAIGFNDIANGRCTDCTFTGNTSLMQNSFSRMFLFYLYQMRRCTITGNRLGRYYIAGDESGGQSKSFIRIWPGTGGAAQYITIAGNTMHATTNDAIEVYGFYGAAEYISIVGNTSHTTGGNNINVLGQFINIANNVCYNTSTTGVDENISIGFSAHVVVNGNICHGTLNGANIQIAGLTWGYQVSHNLVWRNGDGTYAPIDTSGAVGAGAVYGNLINGAAMAINGAEQGVTAGPTLSVSY